MSEPMPNIASLLNAKDAIDGPALEAIGRVGLEGILSQVDSADPKNLLSQSAQRVAAELHRILNLNIDGIIAGGWSTYQDLAKFTDPLEYGPEETVTCVLGKHEVEFIAKPAIDVLIDGAKAGALPFELKLTVVIDGATLTIRDGKVWQADLVRCLVAGKLTSGNVPILKRDIAELPALKTLRFAGGWQLKKKDEAREIA